MVGLHISDWRLYRLNSNDWHRDALTLLQSLGHGMLLH